jgi:ribonucleoside-diphosphate reductase alpha chain
LADERQSITHKFSVDGHEGYVTVGVYEDGKPGEIFITMAKSGSVVSGLMDSFATSISIALQYGVPLQALVKKFVHSRFEPSGRTNNPQIPMAKSVMDYLFRWLALKFIPEIADEVNSAHKLPEENVVGRPAAATVAKPTGALAVGGTPPQRLAPQLRPEILRSEFAAQDRLSSEIDAAAMMATADVTSHEKQVFNHQSDAPPCSDCGSIMVRNGSCYKCLNCGITSGCS